MKANDQDFSEIELSTPTTVANQKKKQSHILGMAVASLSGAIVVLGIPCFTFAFGMLSLYSYLFTIVLGQKIGALQDYAAVQKHFAAVHSLLGLLNRVPFGPGPVMFALMVVWVYLSNRNLRQMGERKLSFSAGWAAWCFLIPIVNIWMPIYAIGELWHGSRGEGAVPALRKHQPPARVFVLWASGWLSVILGIVSDSLRHSHNIDVVIARFGVLIGSALFEAVGTGLMIGIVFGISRAQEIKRTAEGAIAE